MINYQSQTTQVTKDSRTCYMIMSLIILASYCLRKWSLHTVFKSRFSFCTGLTNCLQNPSSSPCRLIISWYLRPPFMTHSISIVLLFILTWNDISSYTIDFQFFRYLNSSFGLSIQESSGSNSSHFYASFMSVGTDKKKPRYIKHLVMQGSDTFNKNGKAKSLFLV